MNTHFRGTFFLTQKLALIADGADHLHLDGLDAVWRSGYAAYAPMKGALESW